MKMYAETKNKMAAQRLKRMIAYYNAYRKGSEINIYELDGDYKIKKYYVLSKYNLKDSYYFVMSDEQGRISIFKIIYNGCPELMEVAKTSKRYHRNKAVFDLWIHEAEQGKKKKI